jgi:hypothetical protein
MDVYSLAFPSAKELHGFLQIVGIVYTEVNMSTLTVHCECSQNDVDKAINAFGARLLKDSSKNS